MFQHPSTTIFFVELVEDGEYAVADHVHPETWWANPRHLAEIEVFVERHLKTANYGFIDGHVEPMRFERTFELDPEGGFPPKFLHNMYDPAIGR
jgi:prepilin-type processing-associated H-X9-DG protein